MRSLSQPGGKSAITTNCLWGNPGLRPFNLLVPVVAQLFGLLVGLMKTMNPVQMPLRSMDGRTLALDGRS
jgi:hypothetical protein